MDIPKPVPALVIRYAYLWADEHAAGREEGSKDRPAAIVMAREEVDGRTIVTVVPITHAPPRDAADAIEIPLATKRRLGLDDERSWIAVTEVNVFSWPGPDIRPVEGGAQATIAYGLLPDTLFKAVKAHLVANIRGGVIRQVPRTE